MPQFACLIPDVGSTYYKYFHKKKITLTLHDVTISPPSFSLGTIDLFLGQSEKINELKLP